MAKIVEVWMEILFFNSYFYSRQKLLVGSSVGNIFGEHYFIPIHLLKLLLKTTRIWYPKGGKNIRSVDGVSIFLNSFSVGLENFWLGVEMREFFEFFTKV